MAANENELATSDEVSLLSRIEGLLPDMLALDGLHRDDAAECKACLGSLRALLFARVGERVYSRRKRA